MENGQTHTFKWLFEWLPELSIAEVCVEFRFKEDPSNNGDWRALLSGDISMIGRIVIESILKVICSDSVKLKVTKEAGIRHPTRLGFSNSEVNCDWKVNVTAIDRSSETAQEITHIDNWEATFYKVLWTHVTSMKLSDESSHK
jgi:hypothetical protein